MAEDIRWKQRYDNFSKAISQLKEFIEKPELNKFEKQGLIQCFQYTFELAWKTAKDYLEEKGIQDTQWPRNVIQSAFQTEMISDGHVWIEALENRNLMAHTYDEKKANEADHLIRTKYYSMLCELFENLKKDL
ncbi:nucleotidyltransferase [candidate division WOR-1 bacterium RIFOXYC2_FULL_37_10]|uniref:Nucleotidyltransferase n=1 Tax=candidate division WOR-1 bacterium RIFOXYB2_FULL_37_13 TaxID=1802579 RepID=A0A1F4SUW4_UNCSA|nr:MAG: nucleotidyltransferase [candidate division WOR-1 bacterium RIFOXYA2_FULL_37_7]OGC24210.1 MAG: nucleotidyltransferase [candidate division WOR-1 bacterium RIFOXYB2_FULL_37_13]OGC36563.1 MAG: nucleotidyltransferase [candidate division WOR-1 bacterium RIFOXYC2_FULL_37_10]